MQLKSICAALSVSVGLLAAAGAAQAANFVEIDGQNVQFFYDADFWGANAASVSGDMISFNLGNDYVTTAKVKASSANGVATQGIQESSNLGVIAVAKHGYQLESFMSANTDASFNLVGNLSYAVVNASGALYQVTGSGGQFTPVGFDLGQFDTYNIAFVNGGPASGSLSRSATAGALGWSYVPALGLQTTLSSNVQQNGPGLSSTKLSGVSYGFVTVPVPVPEPGTYAMLLAGLGMLGLMARYRKS